jgi:multidrug efflux pump subunit AcrA (membrane-fusion protein)
MSQLNRTLAWGKAKCTKRVLVNVLLVVGATGAATWLLFGRPGRDSSDEPVASSLHGNEAAATSVQLPPKKLATAKIETHRTSMQSLTHMHTVPGRLEYDAARRLQLRLPVECVVKEVFVQPGQQVSEGAKLAILTSKQIGLARDEVQQCEEDLRLAQREQQRADSIAANVEDLLTALAQSPEMSVLEAEYKDRPLGEHRQTLLAAYSELRLAKLFDQNSEALSDKGVLSGRVLQERRNTLERANATFQGVCEQAKYQLGVKQRSAEIAVARAERARKICSEQFAALLGPYGTNSDAPDASFNEFVLTAPFAGSIEERHILPAAVVAATSPLFTLANTDQLWVSAQIHERNWKAASVAPGQTVRVRTPATGEREFTATIEFVGAVVNQETQALPLIAKIDNADHLLKPGMFVWVSVPVEEERHTLAVPASAVMRHEGETFVFVAEADNSFRRVDITTGLETEEWVEVQSGLSDGATVAASGAFALKSELLLEREEG